jgi:tetratricopeptide (TPR) repeat protein
VDGVLEGTVLRAGNRIRIRAQLIHAPSDQHLWAKAYDRDGKDVLTLQATLARDIADEIRLNLTSQAHTRLAQAHPVDPEAHEFYLKGRYFWNKRDKAGIEKAVEYFQRAIAKDPNYAVAYAGLSDAYIFSGDHLHLEDVSMARAKAAADKALALDNNLAEAEASLGLIALFTNWNWEGARTHFERAIALDPNYATAHHWYAEAYLMSMGRVDSAIAEIRKAQELDPLSPVIATDLGKELYFAHKYDEAIVALRRALELDPDFVSAHNWLSDTFLEKGMYPEATAELEKTRSLKEERVYLRQRAYLHARMGQRAEAERDLAESLRLSQGRQVSSGAVALVYAMLGRKDNSFQWLENAYAERSSFMTTLKLWPAFDPMRGDPRFSDLLRKVGLPE